jgi:hypothetical protein
MSSELKRANIEADEEELAENNVVDLDDQDKAEDEEDEQP